MALNPGLRLTVAITMAVSACTNGKPEPAVYEQLPTATPTPEGIAAEVCRDVVAELALPPEAEETCTDDLLWYIDALDDRWPGPHIYPTGVSEAHSAATGVVGRWVANGYLSGEHEMKAVNTLKVHMRNARIERGW